MAVQITPNDLIMLGHGTYEGGAANFVLPDNVELHVLQPVGTCLRVALAQQLISGAAVATLWLMDGQRRIEDLTALGFPHVYSAGVRVPELTLYGLGSAAQYFQNPGQGMQVLTVAQPTSLQALLALPGTQARIDERKRQGHPLRVFWLACANQLGTQVEQTKTVDC